MKARHGAHRDNSPVGIYLSWLCLGALLFVGCTTTVEYEPRTDSSPAKPKDYPIYVYPGNIRIPRPSEVIGSASVDDTPFTVKGGTLEAVLETLRKQARKHGADAVHLTRVQAPDFLTPNHRASARLIRFTTPWETYAITDAQLVTYFQTNTAAQRDPIEGIYSGNDMVRSRVVIWKNDLKPGRDFVALILKSENPTWHVGNKKMDIRRGERPGVYRADFFLDDYQSRQVALSLRDNPSPYLYFVLPGQTEATVFIKEYQQPSR